MVDHAIESAVIAGWPGRLWRVVVLDAEGFTHSTPKSGNEWEGHTALKPYLFGHLDLKIVVSEVAATHGILMTSLIFSWRLKGMDDPFTGSNMVKFNLARFAVTYLNAIRRRHRR